MGIQFSSTSSVVLQRIVSNNHCSCALYIIQPVVFMKTQTSSYRYSTVLQTMRQIQRIYTTNTQCNGHLPNKHQKFKHTRHQTNKIDTIFSVLRMNVRTYFMPLSALASIICGTCPLEDCSDERQVRAETARHWEWQRSNEN